MKENIFKDVADAVEVVQKAIEEKKPKNGDDGVSVVGGKVVDGELILTLSTGGELNVGIVKGKDGEDGEDGEDAVFDKEEVVQTILKKIPKPEKINEADLIERVLSKVPKNKVITVGEVIEKIKNGKELSYADLKDVPDIVELIKKYTAHLEGKRTIVGSGASAISRMLDVDLSGLEEGQVLSWNGRAWVPATPTTGGGGTPASTVVDETTFGQSSDVGTDTEYARQDHSHGTPADPIPAHVGDADPHTQYQKESEKDSANGYAGLDAGGKINSAQLPAIAISDTFVVASQVAMLALTAQTGDVAVRSDLNKSYILAGTDPTNLAHWQELLTPTDQVLSFNGRVGAVTPQASDYTGTQVVNTPAGTIASTTVQGAINELDADVQVAKQPRSFGITIDGGGSVITTGFKGFVTLPFNGVITRWDLVGDAVGSIVIDVWKDTYVNFPPTAGDGIAGTEKPTLSSAQKNQDSTLSTWTTAVAQGDVVGFNVDSVSVLTKVTLVIWVTPV